MFKQTVFNAHQVYSYLKTSLKVYYNSLYFRAYYHDDYFKNQVIFYL